MCVRRTHIGTPAVAPLSSHSHSFLPSSQVLATIATGTPHINQNTLVEYLVLNADIYTAVLYAYEQVIAIPSGCLLS